jgi:hypothetical protein
MNKGGPNGGDLPGPGESIVSRCLGEARNPTRDCLAVLLVLLPESLPQAGFFRGYDEDMD